MTGHDVQKLVTELHIESDTRIVLVVADGLGGLPRKGGRQTELEAAATPHLDDMARSGILGLIHPALPGITCGSGPGHLGLFGYDPLQYRIGRGVLSALGIEFDLQPGDVAARGNFCTLAEDGTVSDRRAGRIPDSEGRRLVGKLRQIKVRDAELFVEHVKEYRFTVIFRGHGLGSRIRDTDPHETGLKPNDPEPADKASGMTAAVVNELIGKARKILKDEDRANMILLRGFASRPDIPSMRQAYGVKACGIAIYPMYRGLSRLLGMEVPETAAGLPGQMDQLQSAWNAHDFLFVHHKSTDSAGEDGDFDRKVHCIEELDEQIPRIRNLEPEVLIVTGDHSTPSRLRRHSWHPVPVLLSAETCRPDRAQHFGETEALCGGLGQFEAKHLMSLALAHAGRLQKFGA